VVLLFVLLLVKVFAFFEQSGSQLSPLESASARGMMFLIDVSSPCLQVNGSGIVLKKLAEHLQGSAECLDPNSLHLHEQVCHGTVLRSLQRGGTAQCSVDPDRAKRDHAMMAEKVPVPSSSGGHRNVEDGVPTPDLGLCKNNVKEDWWVHAILLIKGLRFQRLSGITIEVLLLHWSQRGPRTQPR
jgi:hypothetical protein